MTVLSNSLTPVMCVEVQLYHLKPSHTKQFIHENRQFFLATKYRSFVLFPLLL